MCNHPENNIKAETANRTQYFWTLILNSLFKIKVIADIYHNGKYLR